jgi:hypothetical protein
VHLIRRPLFGLLYQPRMMDDDVCGAVGGMNDRRNRSTQRKPSPVSLCPPQIPYDLNRARTRAAAVESRRITTELRHSLSNLLLARQNVFVSSPPLSKQPFLRHRLPQNILPDLIRFSLLCVSQQYFSYRAKSSALSSVSSVFVNDIIIN